MSKTPTRQKAGAPPACLEKAGAWLQLHPLAVELLALAAVAGLFTLEVMPWLIP